MAKPLPDLGNRRFTSALMGCDGSEGIISKIDFPLLILQSSLDPGMPPWTYYHIPEVIPSATVEFLNSAWLLQKDAPQATASAMSRFFKKTLVRPEKLTS